MSTSSVGREGRASLKGRRLGRIFAFQALAAY